MDCPKCSVGKLNEVAIRATRYENAQPQHVELKVAQCFTCQGVWFDAGELKQYLKGRYTVVNSAVLPDTALKELDEQVGQCPCCHVKMGKRRGPKHLMLDYCAQCRGVWLDCTEIDRIESKGSLQERLSATLEIVRSLIVRD